MLSPQGRGGYGLTQGIRLAVLSHGWGNCMKLDITQNPNGGDVWQGCRRASQPTSLKLLRRAWVWSWKLLKRAWGWGCVALPAIFQFSSCWTVMLNSLENLMNILRISGEMSLWKAWDQFWAVKGQKKKGRGCEWVREISKSRWVIFWLFTPMEGVFNTCTCPLSRAFDNNIR